VDVELQVVYAQYEDFNSSCNSKQDVRIASQLEAGIPAGGSRQRHLGDLGIAVPTGCDTYVVSARASVPATGVFSQTSCATPQASTTLSLVDCTAEPYATLIKGDLLFSHQIDFGVNGTCANARREYAVQVVNRPTFCGNGVCNAGDGEDCVSCPQDCNGVQDGKPSARFCCGDGGGVNPAPCSDTARCASLPFQCTDTPAGAGSGTSYEAGVYAKYVCSMRLDAPVPCESFTTTTVKGRNKGSAGTGMQAPAPIDPTDPGPDILTPGECLPLGYHKEDNTGRFPACCDVTSVTKAAVQCAFFAVTRVGQAACRPAFLSPETKSVDLFSPYPLDPAFTCASIQPDFSNVVLNNICEPDENLDGVLRFCPGGCNNDGVCDANEICQFCPFDCTYASGGDSFCCGDGVCEAGEACGFCSRECAAATCCGNGVCETGESCTSCPSDCVSSPGGHVCGNGICEPDEDCNFCPQDCRGVFSGSQSKRFCCSGNIGGAGGYNPVDCSDPRCTSDGWACTTQEAPAFCCGNGACETGESSSNCGVDCASP
jgi:hypothetical protein